MLLTGNNICFYLLDKGLLDLKQIVDGEFRVDCADSRNSNFIINKDFDRSYFIKQAKNSDRDKVESIRTEATCYWLASNDDQYKVLKEFTPVIKGYDKENDTLILELEPDSHSLYDYYLSCQLFSTVIAERMAQILASIHQPIRNDMQGKASMSYFKKNKPWIMELGDIEQYESLLTGKKAETQLLELIKRDPKFVELIAQACNQWQPSSLIHGDIKFPNFLINRSFEANGDLVLKLIDWELANIGDPCWDIAAIFQNYLSLWVYNDIDKNLPQFSLFNLQPSMKAFWYVYKEKMQLTASQSDKQLKKAMQYCALKLIHCCFESTPYTQSLRPHTAKLLQLSFNILKSPQESTLALLNVA